MGVRQEVCGVLCLNKPQGVTSRDVVNLVQRWGPRIRAGHAGTLDPLATGVLVVCLGRATRLIPFVQELPKLYRATFLLGRSSPTDDIEGPITMLENPPVPVRAQVEAVLPEFVGTILQRPPVFSAVKICGRRGYEWARNGMPQEPKARPVEVHELKLLRYEYPELELEIRCGSGTYVRSIGRDLGRRLGTAAVMAKLARLAVGHFVIESAGDPRQLGPDNWHEWVLPATEAVKHLIQIRLGRDEIRRLLHGQWVLYDGELTPGQKAVVVDEEGNLMAIVQYLKHRRLRPLVNVGDPAGET